MAHRHHHIEKHNRQSRRRRQRWRRRLQLRNLDGGNIDKGGPFSTSDDDHRAHTAPMTSAEKQKKTKTKKMGKVPACSKDRGARSPAAIRQCGCGLHGEPRCTASHTTKAPYPCAAGWLRRPVVRPNRRSPTIASWRRSKPRPAAPQIHRGAAYHDRRSPPIVWPSLAARASSPQETLLGRAS